MKHRFAHGVDRDTAARAARAAWDFYRERYARYDLHMDWSSPYRATLSFRAKGASLRCDVDIGEQLVEVEFDLPFLLRPFQGRMTEFVEREARSWIERAKAEVPA